jgi:hypothetical protein
MVDDSARGNKMALHRDKYRLTWQQLCALVAIADGGEHAGSINVCRRLTASCAKRPRLLDHDGFRFVLTDEGRQVVSREKANREHVSRLLGFMALQPFNVKRGTNK